MSIGKLWRGLQGQARRFLRNKRGNVAMIYALSLIPITVAAGAGLDLGRAMVVRARLAEALDAAGLAVGSTSGLTNAQMQTLAQQYFNANYTADSSFGIPASVTVTPGTQQVTLTTSVQMPTTLMNVVGIRTMSVGYTSTIVWGQTKLWVSLVLDNTGSMTETDSTGTSKIAALKTASDNLLTTLQSVAVNAGDVQVDIIPFSKDVRAGTSYVSAGWIDWSDWEAAPPSSSPSTSIGPGSSCPYGTSKSPYGYGCMVSPTNNSSTTSTIPSSGAYSGYICPDQDNGKYNTGRGGHYYNGCYNSVPTKTKTTTTTVSTPVTVKYSCTTVNGGSASCSQTSSSTGSATTNSSSTTTNGYTGDSTNSSTASSGSTSDGTQSCSTHHSTTTCTFTRTIVTTTVVTTVVATGAAPYNHTWIVNDHSTWDGCIEDRTQDYDVSNATGANFPAENTDYCPPSSMLPLSSDWTNLKSTIDNMSADGSTNQPVGLAWGWQAQTNGDPFNPGSVPQNTSQVIIILSDGLNTQDRWYGDGSNQSTQVDGRMATLCTNAKAAGFTIYAVFVDLNGTQGNSTVLQNCATDNDHYFDLTTSGAIVTAFSTIATQITQLRVAQ
ncbi:MAG TPA: pilus assembly protein [Rhizomicrobium sp.]|jgi:Flp pilus assembly protein TadG